MNIKEDYVSFETAKLLKEKGFNDIDCECHGWIGRSGKHYSAYDTFYDDKELKKAQEDRKDFIPLITLQMAMKWLREVHNIHIVVHPYTDKEGHHFSFLFDSYAYGCWQELGIYITDSWNTYEEASEVAIKYCLENLI